MTLTLTSTAFEHGGEIPARCTCEGKNAAPDLAWSGVPAGTKSLALIVDDPDAPDPKAPQRTWVHWVVYDMDPASSGIAQGGKVLPQGARSALNDWNRTGYGGPCPPIGEHRYFHKLYALDCVLGALSPANKASLEAAMQGHILAQAVLLGRYKKKT